MFWDEFIQQALHTNNHDVWLSGGNVSKDALRECVVVRIDNVADYFYLSNDDFGFDAYPNLAPPFKQIWFEWNGPTSINDNGEITSTPDLKNSIWGVLVTSIKNDDGFLVHMFSMCKNGNIPMFVIGVVVTQLDNFGKHIGNKEAAYNDFLAVPPGMEKQDYEYFSHHIMGNIGPACLAISFMHCKNVSLVEHRPHKTPSGRNRRGHRIIYKTLEIEPLKKILRNEGDIHHTGLKQALHICRGHFKDFSKGAGLFGKYKGLYWWDSQVRGSAEHGEVRKDYDVKL